MDSSSRKMSEYRSNPVVKLSRPCFTRLRQVKQMPPLNKRKFRAGVGSTRDNPAPEDDLFRRAEDENSRTLARKNVERTSPLIFPASAPGPVLSVAPFPAPAFFLSSTLWDPTVGRVALGQCHLLADAVLPLSSFSNPAPLVADERKRGKGRKIGRKKGLRQRESTKKGEEERQRLTSGLEGIRKPPSVLGPCPAEFLDFCMTFWANLPPSVYLLLLSPASLWSGLRRIRLLFLSPRLPFLRSTFDLFQPPSNRPRRIIHLAPSLVLRASLEEREKRQGIRSLRPRVLSSCVAPFSPPCVADRTPDWARVIRQRAEG